MGAGAEDGGAPPFWLWRQALPSSEVLCAHGINRGELGQATERFALFDDATRQLFAATAGGAVLLVLDDVHWADQPSLLLLRHVARELREVRLLVVATYRTTRADATAGWRAVLPDLIREPCTEQIELSGLSAADTARFAEAMSDRPLPGAVGAALHSMTGGNPFFVREVARNLAASAGSDVTVPASVTGLITACVERLSPLTRRLLGAAAVLGEQFAVAVVASLIGQPVMACMQPFEEAKDSGLLEATATAGEWRFAHGLVRDAVEAGLPVAEKVNLHRVAAQAIERRYAGHLAPRLADLAPVFAHGISLGEPAGPADIDVEEVE